MNWDKVTLVILAAFGCITLLLAQVSDLLSRLPQIIHAWRRIRHELSSGLDSGTRTQLPGGISQGAPTPDTTDGDRRVEEPGMRLNGS
ncbi:hypothetical protein ABT071_34175 [Streptomyces sp. NPDC002506]|uniref:hypothetical protein n=1 Tax=Streptomyces sp. NPDC002506 TaxID=3154536 RepID=UPI00331C5F35